MYINFIYVLGQEFLLHSKFDSCTYDDFKSYSNSSDQMFFPCPTCPKIYRGKYTLARHLRLECGKSPTNKCSVCGQLFTHKHRLLSHIKSIHYGYYLSMIVPNLPDQGPIPPI